MTTAADLIETMARAMAKRVVRTEAVRMNRATSDSDLAALDRAAVRLAAEFYQDASAALAAIEAAGYDLVLRQHRDMGPGFTHHEGADCPCFAAAPKHGGTR